MKILQKNYKISTIALILVLTFSAILVALPVTAHDPAWTVTTYTFLSAAPNPIGVDQTATILFWLSMVPPTASGAYGDRWTFNVEVTKPDGSKENLGPFTSDPVGSGYTFYTPDQIGEYTILAKFVEHKITGLPDKTPSVISNPAYVNDIYSASTSNTVTLIVQEEPIQPWPGAPLPDGYWERPIYGENREWWPISGNWLRSGYNPGNSFAPYTKSPNSAHIVWTRPITFGGLIGGEFGGGGTSEYYAGLSYESKFISPVIMQGGLYYNEYPSIRYADVDSYRSGVYRVDIRTGETDWWKNSTVDFGQIYNYISPNAYGGIPYVWRTSGSTWYMYDAFNGNYICEITGVPSGPWTYSNDGSILVYNLDAAKNRLTLWNSSLAIWSYHLPYDSNRYWNWRPPVGATVDGQKGIQWNVTVPAVPGQSIRKISSAGDVILATATLAPDLQADIGYDATTGQRLWVQNRTTVIGSSAFNPFGPMADGVYTFYAQDTMQWYCYDYMTGNLLWGPTVPYTDAWGMYGAGSAIAYGKLYTAAWDGKVHCYNVKTGEHLWDYSTGSSGFETVYGTWPLPMGFVVADGKVYVCAGHTHLQPMFRGARIYCIDANTGNPLWNVTGWLQNPSIADGYLVAFNVYDNQLYCFGKGQTATTVTAPDTAINLGSSVVIKGTVTDQSKGAEGTPAISDDDMTPWMEYLYMQKPMHTDAKGVEVKLETLDPNGNFYEIGTVISDASGMYKLMWEPPVEGEYTIIATFEGSESYWTSNAETAIGVTEAPSPAGPIEPEPTEAPFITTEIAIIAAVAIIAVVGIVAFWALKKRK